MSGHVFISYSRADRAYVDKLAAHLASEGVPVWHDYELAAGDRFATVIQHQIDTCAAFVVVLTPASMASAWVSREVEYALGEGRPLLPVLLAPCKSHILLVGLHREDVTGDRLPSAGFLARLARLTATAATHRSAGAPSVVAPVYLLRHTLSGHTGWVVSVAYAPDGRHLATAGGYRTVRIWDAATGTHRHTLTGHTGWVVSVAYAPDGRHLATAGSDKTVRIWDAATATHRHTLTGHTGHTGRVVSAVAYAPDGRHLATTGGDNTARIWELTHPA